jgi:hypothetical protein
MSKTLTVEQLKAFLHYDPETGVFTRLVDGGKFKAGEVAGGIQNTGYVAISVYQSPCLAHRLAHLYMTGSWPMGSIDHINGNRSDNRWSNLRDVPHQVNIQNRQKAQKNSTTGVLGVSWYASRSKFTARIKVGRVYKNLGYFDSVEAASTAFLTAKRKFHPGCTI